MIILQPKQTSSDLSNDFHKAGYSKTTYFIQLQANIPRFVYTKTFKCLITQVGFMKNISLRSKVGILECRCH